MGRFLAAVVFAILVAVSCTTALKAGTTALERHKAAVDAQVDAN